MKGLIAAAGLAGGAATLAVLPDTAAAQHQAADPPYALSANLSLVSEYRYRGISQTDGRPALQGGFDHVRASGAYLGTWLSTVSWLSDQGGISSSLEWDFYGGYKGKVGDFGYDLGLLHYHYPGRYPGGFVSPDTLELYVAGSWKMLTLKYSHALGNLFGFADSRGAGYLDLSGDFDLGSGHRLVAHVGHQHIPATAGRTRSDCSYTDWKLGVSREFLGLDWGLAYVDTDARGRAGQCYRNAFGRDLGRGNVVLSVGKTF